MSCVLGLYYKLWLPLRRRDGLWTRALEISPIIPTFQNAEVFLSFVGLTFHGHHTYPHTA